MKMNEPLKEQNKKKPTRRKRIIAAGIIFLFVISALVVSLFQQEAKPDPTSEAEIRQVAAAQLNKNPNELTKEDFGKITKLDLLEKEICDIKLLEKFDNLERLIIIGLHSPECTLPKWKSMLIRLHILNIPDTKLLDIR